MGKGGRLFVVDAFGCSPDWGGGRQRGRSRLSVLTIQRVVDDPAGRESGARVTLQDATSVASLKITTEAMVAETPKK
jgi:hypothetical protein